MREQDPPAVVQSETHLEVLLTFRLDHVKELLAIFLVDEPVVEDPVNLVAPKSDQLVRVSKVGAAKYILQFETNKFYLRQMYTFVGSTCLGL